MDRVHEWLFASTGHEEKKATTPPPPVHYRKTPTKMKSISDEESEEIKRNDYNIMCHRCEEPVNRDDAGRSVEAEGRVYHMAHFNCLMCGHSVLHGYYPHHAGEIICRDCFCKISNPPCAGCDLPLRDTGCRAQNKYWHRDCIRCTACKQIISKDYCDLDGRLFHESCIRRRLHGVSKERVAADK